MPHSEFRVFEASSKLSHVKDRWSLHTARLFRFFNAINRQFHYGDPNFTQLRRMMFECRAKRITDKKNERESVHADDYIKLDLIK